MSLRQELRYTHLLGRRPHIVIILLTIFPVITFHIGTFLNSILARCSCLHLFFRHTIRASFFESFDISGFISFGLRVVVSSSSTGLLLLSGGFSRNNDVSGGLSPPLSPPLPPPLPLLLPLPLLQLLLLPADQVP